MSELQQPQPGAKGRTRWPRANTRRLARYLEERGCAAEPTSRGHVRAIHRASGKVRIFSGTPRSGEIEIARVRSWLRKVEPLP